MDNALEKRYVRPELTSKMMREWFLTRTIFIKRILWQYYWFKNLVVRWQPFWSVLNWHTSEQAYSNMIRWLCYVVFPEERVFHWSLAIFLPMLFALTNKCSRYITTINFIKTVQDFYGVVLHIIKLITIKCIQQILHHRLDLPVDIFQI